MLRLVTLTLTLLAPSARGTPATPPFMAHATAGAGPHFAGGATPCPCGATTREVTSASGGCLGCCPFNEYGCCVDAAGKSTAGKCATDDALVVFCTSDASCSAPVCSGGCGRGTCVGGLCICPPSYSGDRCEKCTGVPDATLCLDSNCKVCGGKTCAKGETQLCDGKGGCRCRSPTQTLKAAKHVMNGYALACPPEVYAPAVPAGANVITVGFVQFSPGGKALLNIDASTYDALKQVAKLQALRGAGGKTELLVFLSFGGAAGGAGWVDNGGDAAGTLAGLQQPVVFPQLDAGRPAWTGYLYKDGSWLVDGFDWDIENTLEPSLVGSLASFTSHLRTTNAPLLQSIAPMSTDSISQNSMLQLLFNYSSVIDLVNLQMYDGSAGTFKASCGDCGVDEVLAVLREKGLDDGTKTLIGFPSGRGWFGSATGIFKQLLDYRAHNTQVQQWAAGLLKSGAVRGFMTWEISFLYGSASTCPDASTSVAADFNQPGGDHDALLHDITAAF